MDPSHGDDVQHDDVRHTGEPTPSAHAFSTRPEASAADVVGDLAGVLLRAAEAWTAAGRPTEVSRVGGAVAAVASVGATLTEQLQRAEDQDVLAFMDLAGQLKTVVDGMLVGVVREAMTRSSGADRSAWLCRRAEFSTVQEMAQHLLRSSPATVGLLKKAATETTGSTSVSGAQVPARFPLLRQALDAGQLSLDQARPIIDRLAPTAPRADPGLFEAAEADLVGRATGGRHGTPAPDPTAGRVIGGSVGDRPEDAPTGTRAVDDGPRAHGARQRPTDLDSVAAKWAAALDQDGPEPRDEAVRRRRGVYKTAAGPDSGARYTIYSTVESEALLDTLLESMINPRSAESHPEANPDSRRATEPGAVVIEGESDTRTMPQRKHDALEALLSSTVAQAPILRASRPHLLVVARAEELLATLGRSFGFAGLDALDQVDPLISRALFTLMRAARGEALEPEAVEALRQLAGSTQECGAGGMAAGMSRTGGEHESDDPSGALSAGEIERMRRGLGAGFFADPRFTRAAWAPQTDEVIPFSALSTLICDGIVQTALTSKGEVMAFSSQLRRYFTANQRRALMIVYPECAVPGCTIRAGLCDAHHIQHVEHGGDTTVENGILLCPFHHNQLHLGKYRIHPRQPELPGRLVTATSIAGRGPTRQSTTDRVPGADGRPLPGVDGRPLPSVEGSAHSGGHGTPLSSAQGGPRDDLGSDQFTGDDPADAPPWVKDAIAAEPSAQDDAAGNAAISTPTEKGAARDAVSGAVTEAGACAVTEVDRATADAISSMPRLSMPRPSMPRLKQTGAGAVDGHGWSNTWGAPLAEEKVSGERARTGEVTGEPSTGETTREPAFGDDDRGRDKENGPAGAGYSDPNARGRAAGMSRRPGPDTSAYRVGPRPIELRAAEPADARDGRGGRLRARAGADRAGRSADNRRPDRTSRGASPSRPGRSAATDYVWLSHPLDCRRLLLSE